LLISDGFSQREDAMENDRREFARYPMFAVAEITQKDRVALARILSQVNNISEMGLGVYSDTYIESGAKISVQVEYQGTEGVMEKDSIDGRVAWVVPQDNLFYVGIIFDKELDPEEQPKLYRYFHDVIKHAQT
jgi:hypothetical protein